MGLICKCSVNTFKNNLCSSFNDAFQLNKVNYIFVTKKKSKDNIIHDSSKYFHLYSSKYEAFVLIS